MPTLRWSVGPLIVAALAAADALVYQLHESWQGKDFLEQWEFFDAPDPTNGFVTYTNASYAQSADLIKVTDKGSLYMGVDHTSTLDPNGPGRESVRIETPEFYHEGLYIIDVAHMPGSICGTWPAFWSVGPSWPDNGEIDIIEGVNKHEANEIVLHTSGSCDVGDYKSDMSGDMSSGECGEASGTIGCVVKGTNGSAGDSFNHAGGGVYAMEWTAKYLKLWFFTRDSIPDSISTGDHPDPSTFGTPMAHLQGSCDFSERFTAQKFILDTTFCGDWAGGIYGDSGCPMTDESPIRSCVNYVAQNPKDFEDAYWEINSLRIYQQGKSESEAGDAAAQLSSVSSIAPAPTAESQPKSTPEVHGTANVQSTQEVQPAPAPTSEAAPAPSAETPKEAPQQSKPTVPGTTSLMVVPITPEAGQVAPRPKSTSTTTSTKYVTQAATCSETETPSLPAMSGEQMPVVPAQSHGVEAAAPVAASAEPSTAPEASHVVESQASETPVVAPVAGKTDDSPKAPVAAEPEASAVHAVKSHAHSELDASVPSPSAVHSVESEPNIESQPQAAPVAPQPSPAATHAVEPQPQPQAAAIAEPSPSAVHAAESQAQAQPQEPSQPAAVAQPAPSAATHAVESAAPVESHPAQAEPSTPLIHGTAASSRILSTHATPVPSSAASDATHGANIEPSATPAASTPSMFTGAGSKASVGFSGVLCVLAALYLA